MKEFIMYETLKAIVPHSTGEILYNLPLVMENKELIQSSFITYNVDIGVKYLCLDGCNPPLYLGDMLSLWGQKEESIWHFYSKGSTEVYTFLVKEMREGLLLCLGWNLEAGHIEVYTVKERQPSENLQSTFDFLNYANRPVSGQKEKLSLAPVIMSGLNSTDIMTALQDGQCPSL